MIDFGAPKIVMPLQPFVERIENISIRQGNHCEEIQYQSVAQDDRMSDVMPMFEELPVYEEDLAKIKAKKPRVNALQDIVIELMNELGLKDSDVVKATGIPWPTFHGWVTGDVRCQLADDNLRKLWQYFNTFKKVSLAYLVYGIGEDPEELNDSNKTA